jgi:hypothetical protein
MMIAKRKLLLIIGISITGVSLGLGVWAATITAPTIIKIIDCMGEKDPNQTFTGSGSQGQLKECASQYPYNPIAGPVLGMSNLLFWAGIIIVVGAIIWIIRDWYVSSRKTGSIRSKSSRYDK